PDIILGQTNYTGNSSNLGGAVGPVGIDRPTGVCYNGTTFYLADWANNRIMGWHGWPVATGQPADFVIGQPDLYSNAQNNGGLSRNSLILPIAMDCANGRLVVADSGNNRILIWNTAPTAGGIPADIILGQNDGTTNAAYGAGGIAVGGMSNPFGV